MSVLYVYVAPSRRPSDKLLSQLSGARAEQRCSRFHCFIYVHEHVHVHVHVHVYVYVCICIRAEQRGSRFHASGRYQLLTDACSQRGSSLRCVFFSDACSDVISGAIVRYTSYSHMWPTNAHAKPYHVYAYTYTVLYVYGRPMHMQNRSMSRSNLSLAHQCT